MMWVGIRICMPERRNISIEQILRYAHILISLLATHINGFPFFLINWLPFIVYQFDF